MCRVFPVPREAKVRRQEPPPAKEERPYCRSFRFRLGETPSSPLPALGSRESRQSAGGAINTRCLPPARRPDDAAHAPTWSQAARRTHGRSPCLLAQQPSEQLAGEGWRDLGPCTEGQGLGARGPGGRDGFPQQSRGPEDRKSRPTGGSCAVYPTLTGPQCLSSAMNAPGHLSGWHPR